MPISNERFKITDNSEGGTGTWFSSITDNKSVNNNTNQIKTIDNKLLPVIETKPTSLFDPKSINNFRDTKDLLTSSNVCSADESLTGLIDGNASLKPDLKSLGASALAKMSSITKNIPSTGSLLSMGGNITKSMSSLTNISNLSSVINKLGGNYNVSSVNPGQLEGMLTSTSVMATNANMPNSFSGLLNTNMNTTAMVSSGNRMMNFASSTGNTNLMTDIAASIIGPKLKAFNPNISKIAISAIRTTSVGKNGYTAGVLNSLNKLDSNWNKNTVGGRSMYSSSNVNTGSSQLSTLLLSNSQSKAPNINNINIVNNTNPLDYLAVGSNVGSTNVQNSISNKFSNVPLKMYDI